MPDIESHPISVHTASPGRTGSLSLTALPWAETADEWAARSAETLPPALWPEPHLLAPWPGRLAFDFEMLLSSSLRMLHSLAALPTVAKSSRLLYSQLYGSRGASIWKARDRCSAGAAAASADAVAGIHPPCHAPQRIRGRQAVAADPLPGSGAHDRRQNPGRLRRSWLGAGDAAHLFAHSRRFAGAG